MTYLLLKTVHILGVTVWLGGMTAILIFYSWLGAKEDRQGLRSMLALGPAFGQKVIGPAVGIALVAAIAMILMYDIGLPLWIWLGIGLMTASMTIGGGIIRKRTLRLAARLESGESYKEDLRSLLTLALTNLLILAIAVAVMVFKPN